MSGKEQFKKLLETMKFMTKDNEWYRLIYFVAENNTCRYKKAEGHKSAKDENTISYEEACKLYTVEIIEKNSLPDEYFFKKIQEPDNDIKRTVSNKKLINYVKEHIDDCKEVIEKLKEIVRTYEDIEVRKEAYKTCLAIGVEGCEELEIYLKKSNSEQDRVKGKKRPSSHYSKLYNPPVGEFGFCCEEEKMAIVFSHIKKSGYDYKSFQREFKVRYRYEASILNQSDMKRLYHKYCSYLMYGKIAMIQAERRYRINTDLPTDILNVLTSYGLRATRADGRGTSHKVSKCRKKKQYDRDRLSGYRIISIKKGIPIAGKKYELYENDIRDFIDKLENGEISLEQALEKERV